jgi:hypothetical protein
MATRTRSDLDWDSKAATDALILSITSRDESGSSVLRVGRREIGFFERCELHTPLFLIEDRLHGVVLSPLSKSGTASEK